jgi:hypothetical protein
MTWEEILKITAPALVWAVACINVVVLPFFNKREALYKDYEGSGALDAALSAIESGRLVDALAGMFNGLIEKQKDKRRRIEIRDLLQSTDFLPDFGRAEAAYQQMSEIQRTYQALKSAANVWRWGALHTLITVLAPLTCLDYTQMGAWGWVKTGNLLTVLGCAWLVTIVLVARGFFRFHSLMSRFLEQLNSAKGGGSGS